MPMIYKIHNTKQYTIALNMIYSIKNMKCN